MIVPCAHQSKLKRRKVKMGKVKTHKASAKRFSVTGTGKVKMNHSHHRHKLGIKDQKRKRHLRTGATIASAKVAANIRELIQK
jgi:large subunit ribosomal protein L35